MDDPGVRTKREGLLEGKEAGPGLLDLSARDCSDVVVLEQILIDTVGREWKDGASARCFQLVGGSDILHPTLTVRSLVVPQ